MTNPNETPDQETKRLRQQLAIERQKNRKLKQQLLTRAADVDELRAQRDQARQKVAELEAENKELLAVADNSALILAHRHIGDLEAKIERLVILGRAVISSPCEVNWTAFQCAIAKARRPAEEEAP